MADRGAGGGVLEGGCDLTKAEEELGYALMLSAVAVPLICALGYLVIEMQTTHKLDVIVIVFATAVFFVIGWPLALVLGAPLAIFCGKHLQEGRPDARLFTIACATVFGAAGVPIVWSWTEEPNPQHIMMITGAVAGFAAGYLFCALADKRLLDRGNSLRSPD